MRRYFGYKINPIISLKKLLVVSFCLLGCLMFSQVEKKRITPDDYHKWYHLGLPIVSNQGTWVGFSLKYDNGTDTLVIKNPQSHKTLYFPNGMSFFFLGDKWAGYKDYQREAFLVDLNTGLKEMQPDVTDMQLNKSETILLLFKRHKKEFIIHDFKRGKYRGVKNVKAFHYNPNSDVVALELDANNNYGIELFDLNSFENPYSILAMQARKIKKIKWTETAMGDDLLYLLDPLTRSGDTIDSGVIGVCNFNKMKKTEFNLSQTKGFLKSYFPAIKQEFPMHLSKDRKTIYFLYNERQPEELKVKPEVWKWNDPYIYKKKIYEQQWRNTTRVGMLNTVKNDFTEITNDTLTKALMNSSNSQALIYNPTQYQPQPKDYPPMDFYLKNLKTGQQKLFLENQLSAAKNVQFSPSGQYIIYFKDQQWWSYDIKNEKHESLNHKLNTLRDTPLYYSSIYDSFPPGWTWDEKSIYMYDEFDIWLVPLGNKRPIRITKGREQKVRFKLITKPIKSFKNDKIGVFEKRQDFIFHVISRDHERSGFAIKKFGEPVRLISLNSSYTHAYWQMLSSSGTVFTYVEESKDVPKRIMSYNLETGRSSTVFQSNPHYKYNKQGMSKKIYYKNSAGKKLSSILHFPVDYKKDVVYPMVVRVYEKQNESYNQYLIPSLYNPVGFNPKNLLNDGYFLLLPDIEYEQGNPGKSAAECIIAATKSALKNGSINPDAIALMGHSFGGYETLYTVTQTDLFKTAIAGSGNPDIIRSYLYIDNNSSLNFNDYEYDQYRMGSALFDNYQGYLNNSALYFAKHINTPLLIWSGKEDYHVYYYQSLSFHLALKRMGKKNTLLLYPNEGHTFTRLENQLDLTVRLQDWLAYYLKGEKKMSWMP
ncbi:S9 family peptidase [Formosa sp. 3Alg 14/1]|uniref:S9 family peptidase n=1 Tax=Formosa sp. 3Alg 14/1 TaxID=3382190 RepID=UPI0039BEBD5F